MSKFTYKQKYLLKVEAGIKLVLSKQNDTHFQFDINNNIVSSITVDATTSDTAITKTFTIKSNLSAYASSYIITSFAKNSFNDTKSQCNLCFNLTNPGGDSFWSITGTSSQGDNQSMFKDIDSIGKTNMIEVQISTKKNPLITPSLEPVLDPNMVFLLDKSDDTLMFRGNAPLGEYNKVSNPTQLINFKGFMLALKNAYKKATGNEMPSHPYELCVIALLGDDSDSILNPEYKSFKGKHSLIQNTQNWYPALANDPTSITSVTPNLTGRICQWQINPSETKRGNYVTVAKKLAENLYTWFKTDLTDSSGSNEKKASTKRIIYFHCSSGHDRTGLIASTYIAYKKIVESKFVNGSNFEIEDLVESYLMGTTLNHIPYSGGHYKQTTYNLGTNVINPNKSRCFLISISYDLTVGWVVNKMLDDDSSLKLKNTKAVSGDNNYSGEEDEKAYVEDKYAWQL